MNINKAKQLCLGAVGALLLGLALPAHAAFIELTPATSTAATGDTVALDLMISGLGDFTGSSVGDFDIDIGFDTSALSLTSWSLTNLMGDFGAGEALDFSFGDLGGMLNLAIVSLLSVTDLNALQPGAFSLATLTFDVLNLEAGNQTLVSIDTIYAIGDQNGNPLAIDSIGNALISNPSTTVPEPSTIALLGLGLAAFGAGRRRTIG